MGYHTLAAIQADRKAGLQTLAGGLLFALYPLALLVPILTDRGFDWLLVRMFPLNLAVFAAITAGGALTVL